MTELALFGSVLRDDFSAASDVDVLVAFHNGMSPGMFQFVQMAEELEAMLQRPVDLLTRKAVERSENYLRRKVILESLRVIYAE